MNPEAYEDHGAAPVLDDAGRALFRLGRAFARMPRRELLDGPPASTDLSAILLVQAVEDATASGADATIGAAAARLGVDPSTASRTVAEAVRAGYLGRARSQADGRAVELVLTDAGRQLGADAGRYQRAVFDAATRDWPAADRDAFARRFVEFANTIAAMLAGGDAENASGPRNHDAAPGDPVPFPSPLGVVAMWHDALNAGDAERLAATSHENVEIAGPRGAASGREVVRAWAERSGIRFEPLRWFWRDDTVVVEQRATWHASGSDDVGKPVVLATAFRVNDGLVGRISRHDGLDEALAEAGIDASHEAAFPTASAPEPER